MVKLTSKYLKKLIKEELSTNTPISDKFLPKGHWGKKLPEHEGLPPRDQKIRVCSGSRCYKSNVSRCDPQLWREKGERPDLPADCFEPIILGPTWELVVLGVNWCAPCKDLLQYLNQRKIPFTYVNANDVLGYQPAHPYGKAEAEAGRDEPDWIYRELATNAPGSRGFPASLFINKSLVTIIKKQYGWQNDDEKQYPVSGIMTSAGKWTVDGYARRDQHENTSNLFETSTEWYFGFDQTEYSDLLKKYNISAGAGSMLYPRFGKGRRAAEATGNSFAENPKPEITRKTGYTSIDAKNLERRVAQMTGERLPRYLASPSHGWIDRSGHSKGNMYSGAAGGQAVTAADIESFYDRHKGFREKEPYLDLRDVGDQTDQDTAYTVSAYEAESEKPTEPREAKWGGDDTDPDIPISDPERGIFSSGNLEGEELEKAMDDYFAASERLQASEYSEEHDEEDGDDDRYSQTVWAIAMSKSIPIASKRNTLRLYNLSNAEIDDILAAAREGGDEDYLGDDGVSW